MKRIFAAFSMSLVLLSSAGCSMQSMTGSVSNRMNGSFSSEVTITTSDSEIKGTLTRYGSDAWSVVFSEPPALAGVQLDFIDEEVTASYKGLAFSVPQSAQAVRTMLEELMDIVDDMAQDTELDGKHEDESFVCEGEIDVGGYTLTFTEDGTPMTFELPAYGLTIAFDTFIPSGTAVTESTAVTETTEAASTESGTQTTAAQPTAE